MPASTVITVRLDPELLAALKDKVRREGTTVSAAIVRLLRDSVKSGARRSPKRSRAIGMFAGQFEDLDLEDFIGMRRQLSRKMLDSVRKQRR